MVSEFLLNLIGSPTKLQIQVVIFIFIITIASASILITIPLYFQDPILICKVNDYFSSSNIKNCNCEDYTIDYENSPKSMTTEFSWICERGYLKDLLGSIAYLAPTIGYLYFTFYINIHKMKIIYVGSIINGIFMIIIYFVTNYLLLTLIMGFYYFLTHGLMILVIILLADISGENQTFRCWSLSICFSGWGFSSILSGFLGYLYYDWRIFFMCYVGLPLILICYYFRNFYDSNKFPELYLSDMIPKKQMNPFRIIKYPSLRSTIITGALLSAVNNINYYGSYYVLGSLMGNIYFNQIFLGLIEIIGYLLSGHILSTFKRKSIMKVGFSITGIVYMMFLFFDNNTKEQTWIIITINVGLALIGKILIDINFSTFLIHTTERLPKSVRCEGNGFIAGIFKIYVAFVPQFTTFMISKGISPFVGFGIINLLALFIIKFIPETFNQKIEDYTIEEIQEIEDNKYIRLEDCTIQT